MNKHRIHLSATSQGDIVLGWDDGGSAVFRASGEIAVELSKRLGLGDFYVQEREVTSDCGGLRWIACTERMPLVDGPAVLGADQRLTVIGLVRFTTDMGNVYEGTDNNGEPAWQLWAPYDAKGPVVALGPTEVTHWLEIPAPPGRASECTAGRVSE